MHTTYPKEANVVSLAVNTVLTAKEQMYCNRYILDDCTLTLPDDADLDGGEICHAKVVIGIGAPAVIAGADSVIEGAANFTFVTTLDAIEICYDKVNTNWFIVTSHINETGP